MGYLNLKIGHSGIQLQTEAELMLKKLLIESAVKYSKIIKITK